MCWELTAAALDAENRTLSMPASAETNITGAGKEDHVSMGGFSARKAVQVGYICCIGCVAVLAPP
jgi:histidine ammonia-lyase